MKILDSANEFFGKIGGSLKKFFCNMGRILKGFFGKIGKGIKAFVCNKRKFVPFIITIISLTVVITTAVICFNEYISDYYRTDESKLSIYAKELKLYDYNVDTYDVEDGVTVFSPLGAKTGFIFYPGGKVEYSAYSLLMAHLAKQGILCVLVEMPYNLAILDINAADGIAEKFPQIENWYIGGHSLGGAMAATYLDSHKDEIDGLVLLASYSTVDMTDSRVLSVYGTEDGVMNREKYESYKKNLPEDFTEVIIQGGNHAAFGVYGNQDGDGYLSKLTNLEQIEQTADAIYKFISEE